MWLDVCFLNTVYKELQRWKAEGWVTAYNQRYETGELTWVTCCCAIFAISSQSPRDVFKSCKHHSSLAAIQHRTNTEHIGPLHDAFLSTNVWSGQQWRCASRTLKCDSVDGFWRCSCLSEAAVHSNLFVYVHLRNQLNLRVGSHFEMNTQQNTTDREQSYWWPSSRAITLSYTEVLFYQQWYNYY